MSNTEAADSGAQKRDGAGEPGREQEDELLRQWSDRLIEALAAASDSASTGDGDGDGDGNGNGAGARHVDPVSIAALKLDVQSVLGLAGRAAHSVVRPAAPLTTFIVGYAAGLAVGAGSAPSELAIRSATETALRLCRDQQES